MTRDQTFPAGILPDELCNACGAPKHVTPCSTYPEPEQVAALKAKASRHRHAGCEDCVFLGTARLPAQSLRGMPNLIQLDFDFWYCPTSGGGDDHRYRTVTARFDDEAQAFYTATYPLRTDTDYQPALREAAARAMRKGL